MGWTSWSGAVETSIGMSVGPDVEIRFLVDAKDPDVITLVLGRSDTEIAFRPETVELLRDRADDALRQLRDVVAAE